MVQLTISEKDGKQLAVVARPPSSTPVFIEDGNDVEFWVRAGPLSRKLNVLETSQYIQQHWATST